MTSISNIFFARTLNAVFGSFLLACVAALLLSVRSILDFTFNWYSVFYVPVVLVAVTAFVVVATSQYAKTNRPCANRFSKIVKGLSVQTCALAALCSASAWFLSTVNPFCRGQTDGRLLGIGCAVAGALFHFENVYADRDFHFPIVQTTKYAMFMTRISDNASKSAKKSFAYTLFAFVLLCAVDPKSCSDARFVGVLWFSISFVLYLFYSFEHIVYLHMTERATFPIVTVNQDGNCLVNALNFDNKIVRSLALYDLYQATINNATRRKEIFSLSFAGNISQNWKIIFNYCINNIKSTTEDMTCLVKHVSPQLTFRRNIPNARLIKINENNNSKQTEENVSKRSTFFDFIEKFRLYNYLFGPLNKEKTLEEFEITVWCCYILSNLAVVSLKEDEYGVVREQLGQIVSTILNLKTQLDLQRRNFDYQKTKKNEYLKTHVKTCVVMLALHFASYTNDIGLDDKQLQDFKKVITLLNNC